MCPYLYNCGVAQRADVDAAPAEDVAMTEATLTPKAGTRPRISLKFRGRTLGGHS